MIKVYTISDNIITSLGFTSEENITQIRKGKSGIEIHDNKKLSQIPFPASLVDSIKLEETFTKFEYPEKYTRFEKLLILSVADAISRSKVKINDPETLLIISTTKGNIDLLEEDNKDKFPKERIYLWKVAKVIQQYFQSPNTPLVISNACISGVLAINTAVRLIQSRKYENVVVVGGDVLSEFIVSGFQSFISLSREACKPFDISHDGLTLGEGAGTLILSSNREYANAGQQIFIAGCASSNDANHISGPSRTGEGLFISIENTLKEAGFEPTKIDYISSHGTATDYNDNMESIALSRIGLMHVPVNSYKGFIGHTLGAAGIIESIIGLYSIKQNALFETKGFEELGVSENINVIDQLKEQNVSNCLKIASGFGGCNAAVLFTEDGK